MHFHYYRHVAVQCILILALPKCNYITIILVYVRLSLADNFLASMNDEFDIH